MGKLGVLLAVAPHPLARIVEHLLDADARFRVLQRAASGADLPRLARRAAPDLVVANLRFLGKEHARVLEDLRSQAYIEIRM